MVSGYTLKGQEFRDGSVPCGLNLLRVPKAMAPSWCLRMQRALIKGYADLRLDMLVMSQLGQSAA